MRILILGAFVFVMLLIGFISMRRTRTVGDFFLGGRNIGPWISAFAYGTTYFSAVLFIGYAGKLGWGFGLHTLWIVLGNTLVGSLLAWWILGKKTRDMTARLNAMTMPAFLAERYKSPTLKVVAALLIFIFLVPYSASVYKGLNYLFQESLIITETQALWLLAILTGIYLVMGGYFAVTLTDFLMGLVMVFGVGTMLTILTSKVGGLGHAFSLLSNTDVCSPALKPGPPGTIPGWVTLASLVIITSFGPWGLPQMVQKFYSIKNSDQVKRAMVVATLFALIITFGGYFTGAMTHLNIPVSENSVAASVAATGTASESETAQLATAGEYTPPTALPIKTGPDGKPIIGPNGKPVVNWDKWIPTFLAHRLPGWVMMVIVMLVLSASMSTLSSLVLVSSSAIAMDLYAGVINPRVERKSVLILMRVLCVLFVLLSLYLGARSLSLIITLMVISWGVLAGAFAAPYIYGLFWKRANAWGAGAGMIAGVGSGVALYLKHGEAGVPLAGAVAMLLPLLVVPIVSLLTSPLPEEHLARIFAEEAADKKKDKDKPEAVTSGKE